MSNWLGFTNQKLYQASLLLDELERGHGPAAMRTALEESALYQMYDAWVSYLNELAGLAGYRQTVDSLEAMLNDVPLVTGEMTELRILREDSYSWLVAFLNTVASQAHPPQPAQASDAISGLSLIAVADTAGADVRGWWQSLSDLIDSQRQNRQES